MKINQKILFVSATVFLLAAGCSKPAQQPVPQAPQTIQSAPSPTPSAVASPTPVSQSTAPKGLAQTNQNSGKPDYTPGYIIVTQTVDGSSSNVPYNKLKDGSTAEDLLKSTHTVITKAYSGIGDFILSIDGNAADSKHFWEFFVGGKSSNLGASSYTLKDGDVIEWKLSAISSSGQ